MAEMEEDHHRRQRQHKEDAGEGEEGAAGTMPQYEVFAQNELIAERLKLLDYEGAFVPLGDSFKPISRHYFVHSTNIGEQFHLFTSICCWLIRRAGIDPAMEMPHEFDDPNATIARILDAIKAKGIEISFSTGKLKSGSGTHCVFVLLHLTGFALEQSGLRFGVINAAEEESSGQDDLKDQVDEAELTADQFDEVEMAEDVDEPAAEAMDNVFESGGGEEGTDDSRVVGGTELLKAIMRSDASDAGPMREELKRVIPQLKVTVRANLKDWRMHVEQMGKMGGEMRERYSGEVKPFLTRAEQEIGQAMERIRAREHHLNEQFGSLLKLYRNRQNELAGVTEQYRESSGTLNSRTDALNALNEEIDQLKQQTEEQGMHNTSGAPILKIKQALASIDRDIFVMRVQIATMEQLLWQSQLSDRLNNTLMAAHL